MPEVCCRHIISKREVSHRNFRLIYQHCLVSDMNVVHDDNGLFHLFAGILIDQGITVAQISHMDIPLAFIRIERIRLPVGRGIILESTEVAVSQSPPGTHINSRLSGIDILHGICLYTDFRIQNSLFIPSV